MQSQNEIIVGYWDCRGRVGPITQILDYCGVPFKLKLYTALEQWFGTEKENFGGDFPNLPYIIDGDKKITESLALINYAAIKGNRKDLLGKTLDDQTKVEVAVSIAKDLFDVVDLLGWTTGNFELEKEETFAEGKVKNQLIQFNKALEGKEWLCGYLTVADFILFEDVELIYDMDKSKLDPYPNLVSFRERFLKMPEVQAHRASDRFIKLWLPEQAAWTNLPNHGQKQYEKITLGYWGFQGLVQIAKYLLEYFKIPYEDKRYNSPEEWMADKDNLGLDFPNLPYLIHGDKKVSESLAIYDYIAVLANRKDMLGSTDDARTQYATVGGVLSDLKSEMLRLLFAVPKEEFEKARETSWTQGPMKDKLTRLDKFLGEKTYLLGKISVLDFVLYYLLDIIHNMNSNKLNEFPKLLALYNRISEIPEIKAFRGSDRYTKDFFSQKRANWFGA